MNYKDLPSYLWNPDGVQKALTLLENQDTQNTFEKSFFIFQNNLKLKSGEVFPITRVKVENNSKICRARLHNPTFSFAKNIGDIGVKLSGQNQGRANAGDYRIFYGSNNEQTAFSEILYAEANGVYDVTMGYWSPTKSLWLANLVDGLDPDSKALTFAHSMPEQYLSDWPEIPRRSAMILINYFAKKFKQPQQPGLFEITKIISGIYLSLSDVDGIGYGSVSSGFAGYNLAIKNFEKLKCVGVKKWRVEKMDNEILSSTIQLIGSINSNGDINW